MLTETQSCSKARLQEIRVLYVLVSQRRPEVIHTSRGSGASDVRYREKLYSGLKSTPTIFRQEAQVERRRQTTTYQGLSEVQVLRELGVLSP